VKHSQRVTSCLTESYLSGWGRWPVVKSHTEQPLEVSSLDRIVVESKGSTILPRGEGRSYGDAALNPEGCTLLTSNLNRVLAFDDQSGMLRCESGLTFQKINELFIPKGWFPMVTPGTQFVTIGGAVAFDVHGKNHHVDSSFCRHVSRLTLLTSSGKSLSCSRTENSELFWATVGGMGLTGIITEVEFSLRRIETAYIRSRTFKARNLDEAFELFNQHDSEYPYSVAWIDCIASSDSLGRGIVMFGDHARISDLTTRQKKSPLGIGRKHRFSVPVDLPSGILNRFTVGLFNTLYYHQHLGREHLSIVDWESYFYPLDFLRDWNRLYGKRGFTQYQFVVPLETSRVAVSQILGLISKKGWGSFLSVLKRLGQQDGWLSFPFPGYTLAIDMPIKAGLWELLDELDQVVMEHGGRVYLAKDIRLKPGSFRKMYPEFEKWIEVKRSIDPENLFSSALSKRLELVTHRV
jgi:decaprenylphospho-beta-D-ribofuranose 2-oxidase